MKNDELDEILRPLFKAHYKQTRYFPDEFIAEAKSAIQKQLNYANKVAENCRLVANSEIPAIWADPLTGKKLYNEAELKRAEMRGELKGLQETHKHWRKTYQSEKVQDRVETRMYELEAELENLS